MLEISNQACAAPGKFPGALLDDIRVKLARVVRRELNIEPVSSTRRIFSMLAIK